MSKWDLKFNPGDVVVVSSRSHALFGQRGTVIRIDPNAMHFRYEVHLENPVPDGLWTQRDPYTHWFSAAEIDRTG